LYNLLYNRLEVTSMSDKVDVIIVGAGPSGMACAYVLAKKGIEVVVIERGKYPGAKNLFGGIFFSSVMNNLIPEFINEAPWERFVSKRKFSMLTGASEFAFEMKPQEFNIPPYNNSFIVQRSKVDKWFANKVEKLGVTVICDYCVEDFVYNNNKIVGITNGNNEDSLFSNIVICAEGANSLLSKKARLRKDIMPDVRSIAVKEIVKLPEKVIEDRFNISEREGAAYEYFGSAIGGLLGNGFVYTNKDSLSVGVGFSIKDFTESKLQKNPNDLLDEFKDHPSIKPLIKDGEIIQYMAHMIPSDGYNNLPKLYRDGLLLVGDAAGLVNISFFHEGINLAMASGVYAAEVVIEAITKKDYSSQVLSKYKKRLKNSFVLRDLKSSRNFLNYLYSHKRFINEYPQLFNEIITDYFRVSENSKNKIKREILGKLWKKTKIARAVTDILGAIKNLT